ncbi:MAG TPA: hypothetical protein VJU77_16390 [Chthoniobacterales bacterium]|nr:hypothetical protein [Chthoniobacterales bacterium]
MLLIPLQVRATTYIVTTLSDTGPGSLAQAILDANSHPNASASDRDRIHFAIPGSGVQTILALEPFPAITDPVVIDGFTQAGALPNSNPVGQGLNASLKVELDGNFISFLGSALMITGGNTTVRGLIINRFDSGITCQGGSGNTIQGNFIGTDPTGTFAPIVGTLAREPRQINGVVLDNCRASRIGGQQPAERNLIAGNEYYDTYITGPGATDNIVEGNLLGTKASGMAVLQGAGGYGVYLENAASANLIGGTALAARNVLSSSESTGGNYIGVNFAGAKDGNLATFGNLVKGNFFGLDVTGKGIVDTEGTPTGIGIIVTGHHNVIGGTEPGARNVISGNRVGGIIIGGALDGEEATENVIQGNFIGTDESGVLPLGNGRYGVEFNFLAHDNLLGGTEPGAGNRIAFTSAGPIDFPAGTGIAVYQGFNSVPSATGNAILGNLVYGNEELGIDLGTDHPTSNDPGDTDTGANNLQNYPELTSADFEANTVRIRGALNSMATQSYRVEFFGDSVADPSGFGEAKVFLGAANVLTGPDGTATLDFAWPCPAGLRTVTATATDSGGNTSEFCRNLSVAGTPAPQVLNISTRVRVQTGDNVLIGGFIVTGTDFKKVLVRAIGPSLSASTNPLADPRLELYQGGIQLASNDNWRDTQAAEIEATGLAPSHNLESAIVRTLAPGAYTAVVQGVNNITGIGLVEVYDVNQVAISEIANISTRGFVETGDNVMIGGLILRPAGGGNATVVVRALGPTLSNFQIAGALQDPTLDLVNSDGGVIGSNNNWKDMQRAEIEALGLAPGDDRESALLQAISPGNYTAIVRGANNTTGVGLVEVYKLP